MQFADDQLEDLPGLHNQEAASSQPTDDGGFDSDALLDPPIQNVGDVQEVGFDGKIKKEILEVGEGVKKPKMNHLATIIYKAYFFDHTEFDSSNGEPIQLSLGDIAWPEGLWKGIQEMRKGEKAKIKIKKKYGFGRKQNVDKLRFPPGYEEEGEKRTRLMTKGIIYEVKLLDWIERIDIEANGNFLKTHIDKPPKSEWEKPKERDEVKISVKAYQTPEDIIFQKDNWETYPDDPEMFLTFRKILESLSRTEKSSVLVKASFIEEEDKQLIENLGDKCQEGQDLTVEMQLHSLIKVEDWFKDGGSCLKRTLRKGKGSSPNTDSTIKLRMRITVNDQVVLSNYEEGDPATLYDLKPLTDEQKSEVASNPQLYTFTLDKYNLPSLLIKVLKSMKKNEVCEFKVTGEHIAKLRTNFSNDYFDQHQLFKDGDKVSFMITLLDVSKDQYFYQMTVAEKLARVQHLKGIAGQFFKVENFKKAAKIYQKINGYYNFGDAANNHQKEDEESEEFKSKYNELMGIKVVSFMNLVVCKHKMHEYQSIIGITDQVIEMDPNNVKCYYFRGKAYLELKEFDNAVKCFTKLVQIDPTHVEGRKELERAKKIRKDFLEDQHRKFSKMFS